MPPLVEARIVEVRRAHPSWGSGRIRNQLAKDGFSPVPGRRSVYRALLRHGLVEAEQRRRRRADYRRWERGRPMELWQDWHIDVPIRKATEPSMRTYVWSGPERCLG